MTNFMRVGPPAPSAAFPAGVFELNDDEVSSWYGIADVIPIGGTWTATRLAQNDVVLRKTAAADTTRISLCLRDLLRVGVVRGYRVASIDVVYGIATAALTTHVLRLDTVRYANATAVVVAAASTLTGALATVTQATPYVTRLTLATPVVSIVALQDLRIELEIVAALTSVYDFYGIAVNG